MKPPSTSIFNYRLFLNNSFFTIGAYYLTIINILQSGWLLYYSIVNYTIDYITIYIYIFVKIGTRIETREYLQIFYYLCPVRQVFHGTYHAGDAASISKFTARRSTGFFLPRTSPPCTEPCWTPTTVLLFLFFILYTAARRFVILLIIILWCKNRKFKIKIIASPPRPFITIPFLAANTRRWRLEPAPDGTAVPTQKVVTMQRSGE